MDTRAGALGGALEPVSCDQRVALGPSLLEAVVPSDIADFIGFLAADVNEDNRIDWVAAGIYFSTFLQNSDGTFADPIVPIPAAGRFDALQAAHLNDDNHIDLLGTGSWSNEAILGDGAGHFVSPELSDPLPSSALAVGDFDGDGIADLAGANRGDQTVTIVKGVGDGTFIEQGTISLTQDADTIVQGDFNGDSVRDLAVGSAFQNSIAILLGAGDGNFTLTEMIAAGSHLERAIDLNGDQNDDLFTNSGCSPPFDPEAASTSVILSSGDGTFEPSTGYSAGCTQDIKLGDVNGDGSVDLVSSNGPSFGNGDGSFSPERPIFSYGTLEALEDFNGDGVLDAGFKVQYDAVYIAYGHGDGSFGKTRRSAIGEIYTYGPPVIVDFNGDGDSDLLLTTGESITLLKGSGDGTFQVEDEYPVGYNPRNLQTADLNQDGRLDLVVPTPDSRSISVYLSDDEGNHSALEYTFDRNPVDVEIGDLNGDGHLDLFVLTNDYPEETVPASFSVLFGRSTDSFTVGPTVALGTAHASALLVDADRNGTLDVILSLGYINSYGGGAEHSLIMLGAGDGTFSNPSSVFDDRDVLAVKDFNGDGKPDLLLQRGFETSIALGRGNAEWAPMQTVHTLLRPLESGVSAVDVDADGRLDLVIDDIILRGYGDGTFGCRERRALGAGSIGDVNGDGRPDFVRFEPTGDDNHIGVLLHGE